RASTFELSTGSFFESIFPVVEERAGCAENGVCFGHGHVFDIFQFLWPFILFSVTHVMAHAVRVGAVVLIVVTGLYHLMAVSGREADDISFFHLNRFPEFTAELQSCSAAMDGKHFMRVAVVVVVWMD